MADLSDDEKAKLVLGGVESEKSTDETTTENEASEETQDDNQTVEEAQIVEDEPSEEQSTEDSEETKAETTPESLTKKFPNLKGETLETYVESLEEAYQNSFTESLRLNNEVKELRAQLTTPTPPVAVASPEAAPVSPTSPLDSIPEIRMLRAQMNQSMKTSFEDFSKEYPQALDPSDFEKFQKASDGVSVAFQAIEGRDPTWPELFKGIAGTLGWQPVSTTIKKDAALKDAVSSSQSSSAVVPPPKRSKVTDEEANVYMRMMNVSRETAIKDLSTVK